ncbi:MAG: transporter [Spongiibacteraceae bacterium]
MSSNQPYKKYQSILAFLLTGIVSPEFAFSHDLGISDQMAAIRADSHAPIGVMGDHRHKAGEWMVSYRFMDMEKNGLLRGNNSITPDGVVTTVANPFPGPAKVRVVPTKMTAHMQMLGVMYAPTDTLTLMLMLNYINKTMEHITYAGMSGTNTLGTFKTTNSGLGDTKISTLWGFYSDSIHNIHINLGLSLPTGSIKESDRVLAPNGMQMQLRMPYGMQLGSGTYDLEPGITYNGQYNQWRWGAQYLATLRLGQNSQEYTLGDSHGVTVWSSYSIQDWISTSARISYKYEQEIDGMNDKVLAPVITANPDNYGGEIINAALGVNLVGQGSGIRGHRLAIEYQVPIYQDVHGVQLESEASLTLGYQYAF